MKLKKSVIAMACVLATSAFAQTKTVEELQAQPLSEVLTSVAKPVTKPNRLGVITWGGDVASIYGVMSGIFQKEGVPIELFDGNDFRAQSQATLNGEPYLRGTLGQILQAAPAFEKAGIPLVLLLQMTYSNGGDALVVRATVKTLRDLRGKVIGLQLYGPHGDFIGTVLLSAGLSFADVTFKWYRQLTPPKNEGTIVKNAVSAFRFDPKLDAPMVISPDAADLTNSEGVKGSRVIISTKEASQVIADVIAVRKDYYDANTDKVMRFTRAWHKSQEALEELIANKKTRAAEYQQLLGKAAELLFDDSAATSYVEGLLADCKFVGLPGNVAFLTGQTVSGQVNLRSAKLMSEELSTALVGMKMLRAPSSVAVANWDYEKLGQGLKNTAPVVSVRFDTVAVAKAVENTIEVEGDKWKEQGKLFEVEINFDPNQDAFPAAKYAADYDNVTKLSQTYAGAVVVIEGFVDPARIQEARQNNDPKVRLMEQAAKNLSLKRAQAVRAAYIQFAKSKNLTVDESQIVAVGRGIEAPKWATPKSPQESAQNRRVTFGVAEIKIE